MDRWDGGLHQDGGSSGIRAFLDVTGVWPACTRCSSVAVVVDAANVVAPTIVKMYVPARLRDVPAWLRVREVQLLEFAAVLPRACVGRARVSLSVLLVDASLSANLGTTQCCM